MNVLLGKQAFQSCKSALNVKAFLYYYVVQFALEVTAPKSLPFTNFILDVN